MHIFITGGAGFIGCNLVRLLVQQGHKVLNFDKLTYASNKLSLTEIADRPNYQFVQGDLCDPHSLTSAIQQFQPTWILHLAAETHVDRSINNPQLFVDANITGTYHLLQATRSYYEHLSNAQQGRFRFVHVSTDEVYGSLGTSGYFTESTQYQPHSPYSASKAAADHLVHAWHVTFGLPVLVTHCSNNYGPYQYPEKLIPLVILSCLRNQPIPVYGTGENIRDWLYVEDHCRALIAVAEQGRVGQTYNIGGNNELRNLELVELICNLVDELVPTANGLRCSRLITFVEDRPGHDLRYAIDSSKIRRELGWHPRQDHSLGLRRTVQWYLDNRAWWQALEKPDQP